MIKKKLKKFYKKSEENRLQFYMILGVTLPILALLVLFIIFSLIYGWIF